jgi:hypothetical protein
LFKYLPSKYLPSFLERGDLLFRSLSYFRHIEEQGRGDLLEGLHMDRPDSPITIRTVDGSWHWEGDGAFLNRIKPDRLLVFCMSEMLSEDLFREFSADACVEIVDPGEFLRRCSAVINRQPRFRESGLLHRRVLYYAPNRPLGASPKDVQLLPFCKHNAYSHQHEYRLAVALKGGLRLTQQIVNKLFTWDEELAKATTTERHVVIGPLKDIAVVHRHGIPRVA